MSGKAKALTALSALFLGGFFVAHTLLAAVTVTPATGGTNISIDTTSAMGGTATYTTFGSVTGPLITESSVGQITAGTHILSLPSGWEFNTAQNVTIGIGGGSNLALTAQVITPGATSLSFNVSSVSSNNPATLNFSGIQVRPTGTVVSTGNMTHSGAFIADVTDGVTNFGTFSTTAGAVKQLGFTTQPTDITYGSNISSTVVKTQDQFGNNSVAGLAAGSNVTITKQSGTGTLSGTTVQDIGTAAGNGTLTYTDLYINNVGAKVLRATGTGLTINTVDSNSFTINQKALTSTITASNKVYDGNTTATIMTRTPVGVVMGDAVTVNGGAATFADKNVANGKIVTATGMTLGDTDAAKYSFNGVGTGTADITIKPITLTVDAAQTKVYGSADPVFTYTLDTPLVGGDTAAGALARTAGENWGANAYPINIGTWSVGSNYALTFVDDDFSITKKPITITAAANTKVYDQNNSSVTVPAVTGGLAFSDTPGFTQVYDTVTVGINKPMTPSGLVNDGNGGTNYSYTYTPANVGVITTKGLTVTGLSASSKVYDQGVSATIVGMPVLNGIIAPDVVTVGGIAAGDHNTANVGATTVAVTGLSLGGADAANYDINPLVLNSSITSYPVTVTATAAQTKVYGTADPVFTYGSTGLLVGDNFSGALDRAAGENIGNYAIGQGTLTAGTNYSITFVADNFGITAKPITLTVTPAQTKVFGSADPVFAYTFNTALIGGDAPTGALARAAGENIGSYAINQGTVTLGANYTITFVADNFTITAKPITVTPDAGQSKIYNTADPVFTYSFSPALIGLDTFAGALDRVAGANVGTYAYTIGTLSAGSNYSLTLAPAVFTINQATPIINWSNPSAIAAGTPLSGTQLNAMANVPGVFTYTPAAGHIYTLVGNYQLSTDFVPTDTLNYMNVDNTEVTILIVPAVIASLDISAAPSSLTVGMPSTINVKGYDAYGNLVTNDSSTRVWVHADGFANLNSASHLLVAGQYNFTLNSLVAGTSLVDTFSGNLVPDEVMVTFVGDTTAPTITMNASPVQGITQNSASIVFQSSEAGMAKVHYGLTTSYGNVTNYQSVTAATDKTITITGLTCGTTYNYVVYAKDAAGNETIGTNDTFMTTACPLPVTPTIAINGASVLPQYTQSAADARFASGVQFDLTNTTSVTVNGSTVANAATITAANNAEAKTIGVHSYDVIAMSSTGHTASLNVSFEVVANHDVTAPIINTVSVVPAPTSASITFTSSEAGTARINYGLSNTYGTISAEYNVLAATNRTITLVGLTCNTPYNFSIGATDLSANTANSADATFTTTACPVGDITAPTLSTFSVDVTQDSATVHFNTDEDGLAKVYYGLTAPAYGQITEYSPITNSSDNIINISGLTCGTQYHYKVYGLDASDNGQDSVDMTFMTSACPVAPVITHANPADVNPDLTTAVITLQSDKTGSAKIHYGLSSVYGNVTDYEAVVANAPATITLTGLACGTTYNYAIYAKDAMDNESNTGNYSFMTDACAVGDITAPTVTAQTPVDNSLAEALTVAPTVTFSEAMNAATVNASTVQLRKYSDDSVIASVVSLDITGMIATITPVDNLANGTQYYIYVSAAQDLAGNDVTAYVTKADQEFTTLTAPTGSFAILSAIMTKMTGSADNTYAHGWEWLVRMTLPTDQNSFALKFNDWVSGANTLPVAGNMEYYSEQIAAGTGSSASPVAVTAANTYPANVTVTNDADALLDGIQTDVHVRVKLPVSTPNGSYSTSYRVNYGL